MKCRVKLGSQEIKALRQIQSSLKDIRPPQSKAKIPFDISKLDPDSSELVTVAATGVAASAAIAGAGLIYSDYKKDPEAFAFGLQRAYIEKAQNQGMRQAGPAIIAAVQDQRDRLIRQQGISLVEARNKGMIIDGVRDTPLDRKHRELRKGKGLWNKQMIDDFAVYTQKKRSELQGLSPEEFTAIRQYNRPVAYKYINGILRGGVPDEVYGMMPDTLKKHYPKDQFLDLVNSDAKLVEQGLSKLKPFKEMSYRGLELPNDVVENLIKTGKWTEKGMMSTTKDLSKAYPGNVVFTHRGHNGKDISQIEPMPNSEVLYPPNTQWKVGEYRKIKKFGKEFHLFHMEQMKE